MINAVDLPLLTLLDFDACPEYALAFPSECELCLKSRSLYWPSSLGMLA